MLAMVQSIWITEPISCFYFIPLDLVLDSDQAKIGGTEPLPVRNELCFFHLDIYGFFLTIPPSPVFLHFAVDHFETNYHDCNIVELT